MKIISQEEDRMKIDFNKNHTVGNLIRKSVWEVGGEAAYDKGHPLDEESILIIESDNPEETFQEAVQKAQEWFEDFEGQIEA